jgi:hypothetical protein
MMNEYNILAGKPERRRPFWRLRVGLKDNIKMDFKVIECEDVNRAQGPVVESCEHVTGSSGPTKLGEFLDQLSES